MAVSEVSETLLNVEVVYVTKTRQLLIRLQIPKNTTVLQAIHRSEILSQCPEIPSLDGRVGIFGKRVLLDRILEEGDRVELYSLLIRDPKEGRRLRAKTQGFCSTRTTLPPLK